MNLFQSNNLIQNSFYKMYTKCFSMLPAEMSMFFNFNLVLGPGIQEFMNSGKKSNNITEMSSSIGDWVVINMDGPPCEIYSGKIHHIAEIQNLQYKPKLN